MNKIRWAAAVGVLGLMLAGCAPTPPAAAPPVSDAQPPAPPNTTPYAIQTGDTLYSIAQDHGLGWRDVVEANPNVNWQLLRSGQVIFIPARPSSEAAPAAPPALEMNPGRPGPIAAEAQFIWPVRGQLPAGFQQRDSPPGIDIAAAPGTPVVAAKSGRVNVFAHAEDEGRMVILEHEDGTATCYGHLGEILVKHGTWVRQGEVIGTVGSSGRARGAELSFHIMEDNRLVSPLPLLSR